MIPNKTDAHELEESKTVAIISTYTFTKINGLDSRYITSSGFCMLADVIANIAT
jgi:hypothetical protein